MFPSLVAIRRLVVTVALGPATAALPWAADNLRWTRSGAPVPVETAAPTSPPALSSPRRST